MKLTSRDFGIHRTLLPALALAAWTAVGARAAPDEPSAPFHLPWEAPKDAVADVSFLLDGPAGKNGPVVVRDGHFAFEKTGKRVRFWGTNLSGNACFPEKEIAPKLADRFAKYGFNLIRFHHMDSSNRDRIFDENFSDTRHLSAERLDRLDYLIADLKKRGIYVNLNLHVGRRFRPDDGVAQTQWLTYGKYCVIFDPRMIELQKEYARQLLTHRNPYTGLTYTEDPAVIIVELTNENSLFGGWTRGFLRGEQGSRPSGTWTDIPPFYGEELTRFYNEWLVKKYGSREALEKAWSGGARKAGRPMLANGDFAEGEKGWGFQAFEDANARAEFVRDDGAPAARITIDKVTGTRWHVMLSQRPLKIEKGEKYEVRFRIKASSPRLFTAETAHAGNYRGYGSTNFEAGTDWQERSFTFTAPDDDDNVRLSFHFGEATGDVWLADVRMVTAAIDGLRDGEDPARGTVRRLTPEEFNSVTTTRFRDEGRFYYDTENGYNQTMYRLLKDDLKIRALVQGTNHNYGLPCLRAESQLDHMDCHAYWQHPRFPNRPWDRNDWLIPNTAMLDNPADNNFAKLCRSAVKGKPFTVSEYNHPYPNEYGCEMPLMLAAYASLQDWDAIYAYTFCHNLDEEVLGGNKVTGYFDVCNDLPKMTQMPAASLLFQRGDVRPAKQTVLVTYETDYTFDSLRAGNRSGFQLLGNVSPLLPLVHRFRVGSFEADRTTRADEIGFEAPKGRIASDTGELVWENAGKGKNYLTIDTPRAVAAVGWIGGKQIKLGRATFEIETPFCAVSLVSLDDKPLPPSERVLVTAAARCANTGMKWNADRTSLGNRWGGPPILIEPVAGRFSLTRSNAAPPLEIVPLDGQGQAMGTERQARANAWISLDASSPTVWHALQAGQ